jgi:hypothetical protein
VSGVAGTSVLVKRHNSPVAFQPVWLLGDPALHARAAEVITEPVIKLSPHPMLDKVR